MTNRAARVQRIRVILLALGMLLAWGRCVGFGWCGWDDQTYVANNPILRLSFIDAMQSIWIQGRIPSEALWIPLTYLTHYAEAVVFDLNPRVLHATNVMLHVVNVILIYFMALALCERFDYRRGGAFAAMVAAVIFGFHPMQVETVAWIMGRKDLLCATGVLAGTLLVLKNRNPWLAVFCFVLAVLAKPTAILAFLIWAVPVNGEKHRFGIRPVGVCCALAIGAWYLNQDGGGGLEWFRLWYLPDIAADWASRFLLFERAQAAYLSRSYFVADTIRWTSWVLLLVIGGGVYFLYREKRWLNLWGIFGVLMLGAPAVQVALAPIREFYTADRYGYLPLIFFLATALPLFLMVARLPSIGRGLALGGLALLLSVPMALRQNAWRSGEALWLAELVTDDDSFMAEVQLGVLQPKKASDRLRRALLIAPGYPVIWRNLGAGYHERHMFDLAERAFAMAIALDPDEPENWYNRSTSRLQQKRFNDALRDARQAVKRAPLNPKYRYQLGLALDDAGYYPEASDAYQEALARDHSPHVAYAAGVAALRSKKPKTALSAFNIALKGQPTHYQARANRAILLAGMGEVETAKRDLLQAAQDAGAQGDRESLDQIRRMAKAMAAQEN